MLFQMIPIGGNVSCWHFNHLTIAFQPLDNLKVVLNIGLSLGWVI